MLRYLCVSIVLATATTRALGLGECCSSRCHTLIKSIGFIIRESFAFTI